LFARVADVNDDTLAGLVAARAITSLRIFRMTGWELENPGLAAEVNPPIVEVQQLGSLEIGEMRQGVVWSGNFDDSPSTPAPFFSNSHVGLPTDAFTKDDFTSFPGVPGTTPQIKIGCMGNGADLWVKNFNKLQVDHSVLGEIHCPNVPSKASIVIGDALGSEGNADFSTCGCHDGDINGICVSSGAFVAEVPIIWSPRYIGNSLGDPNRRTAHGRIWISSSEGLNDQIILNANNNSVADPASHAEFWRGEVIVGPVAYGAADPGDVITDNCIVLSPDAIDADHLAPFYGIAPGPLGGGAVGVAPFHLYDTDGFPINNQLIPAPVSQPKLTVVSTDFEAGGTNDATPVTIGFYGPIYKSSGSWNSKVRIDCIPLSQQSAVCTATGWQNITSLLLVRGPGDLGWTQPRALGLSRANSLMAIGPGIYRVTFLGVKCTDLLGNPAPHPLVTTGDACPEDAFYFRVGRDCPRVLGGTGDGIDDSVQTGSFICPTGCGDFNNSGGITVQDIFDFLAAWFAQCTAPGTPDAVVCFNSADFNRDHTLSVQDIFDFLAAWFAGNNCT
jgi:hypothetical protein